MSTFGGIKNPIPVVCKENQCQKGINTYLGLQTNTCDNCKIHLAKFSRKFIAKFKVKAELFRPIFTMSGMP